MDLNSLIYSENAGNIQLVVNAKDLRDFADNLIAFAKQEIKQRDENPYYTREELETMLHVSAPTLVNYRKKGLIPEPVIIDGKALYNKAEVNKAIANNKIRIKIRRKEQ